ncbi:MAG: hypothetical protein PHS56_07375 [Eubacteriales bacterium]|nr:hypothetical protein [Eubacteriales bacterium]
MPQGAAANITYAVIRKGDLWLGTDSTHLWRQTDSGDVAEAVWAPDGHAIAFLRTPTLDAGVYSLHTLVPGDTPVLVDQEVNAISSWLNSRGFLWSPDSTQLAYGVNDGTEIGVAGPGQGKGSFLIDLELEQGPYWLSNDCLVYSSAGQRPSLAIVNTMGDVINTLPDTSGPYPINDGIFAVSGEYDPDGIMECFYYTGIVHAGIDGANVRQVYNENPDFCLFSWNPLEPSINTDAKYFAVSNAGSLFLQKYAGLTKAYPEKIDLLTQDIYLTYSEFSYPFWFAWAPDGNSLAALRFTLTQEGDFGEQEGVWDLVRLDREGNPEILLANIYSVSGDEQPIPFLALPFNWSPEGSQINYLVEGSDGDNLWQINLTDKTAGLFLENSGLPEYRPHTP